MLLVACAADLAPAAPDPSAATSAAIAEAPPERPEFVGVVTARNTKVITAEFEGNIKRITDAGRKVHAGDVIASLDDSDLKMQLAKAKASEKALQGEVGAAGAKAGALARQAKNEKILARAGAAPMASVRSAAADASAAGASTSAASGRLAEASVGRQQIEFLLTKAEVKAPIDGEITMISAREGELATKGRPLARVYDPSDLIVRFAVPKELRATVASGKRVELQIEGTERTIWAIVGKISEASPPVDYTLVEADIDDSKLLPDEVRFAASARVRIADASPGVKR